VTGGEGEGDVVRSPYERRAGTVPRRGERGANRARFPRWGNRSVTSNHISRAPLKNVAGNASNLKCDFDARAQAQSGEAQHGVARV